MHVQAWRQTTTRECVPPFLSATPCASLLIQKSDLLVEEQHDGFTFPQARNDKSISTREREKKKAYWL